MIEKLLMQLVLVFMTTHLINGNGFSYMHHLTLKR